MLLGVGAGGLAASQAVSLGHQTRPCHLPHSQPSVRFEPLRIVVPIVQVANLGADAGTLKVQAAVHLVLVPRQNIGTDNLGSFEISATVEAVGVVDVAAAVVDCCLRIETD